MLKKTMTYVDFNGTERTEDFYFNLTKAELTEMQLSQNGGFDQLIQRVVSAQDTKEVIKIFKTLICKSYGVKSLDGKKFIKNEEVLEDFTQTQAYSDLFMELATDSKKAAEFVNGIIPKDIAEEVAKNGGGVNALLEASTENVTPMTNSDNKSN